MACRLASLLQSSKDANGAAHLQALADVVAEERHGGVHVADLRQVEAVHRQDCGRNDRRQIVQLRPPEQQLRKQGESANDCFWAAWWIGAF